MTMASLRRRFLFVAAAVLVPVALLVWRALSSLGTERRLRHEVVAERLFDEMERSLSDVLAIEEARPFEAYVTRSAADRPFVRGYFQVDPDGRTQAADAAVRTAIEPVWRGGRLADGLAADRQRPGSTAELAAQGAMADEAAPAAGAPGGAAGTDDASNDAKQKVSAYDALRSLNKAVEQRVARQRQMADDARSDASGVSRSGASRDQASAAANVDGGRRAARSLDLPPMAGRLLDPSRLVLYRTVVRDGRGFRQGLIVDVPALGAWLREQAVGGGELRAFATVGFSAAGVPAAVEPAAFAYRHRFAEPFADVTAQLALQPLPGVGGAGYVQVLAALLLLAVVLGLGALYRMVEAVVGFAERRSNFVAAVSHELKTPLTAIRMYGEMLRDGIVTSDAKRDEYHRHITAESERLSRLINNVLEFSKLEKNARPVTLARTALGPLVAEAATLLAPHVEQSGFRLRVTTASDLPPVRLDRDAFLQIVFNLVDNAVKYASAGEPKEIELTARTEGGRVSLAVRDHGPGVPSAQLPHVFEAFYRGERELTRRHQGVGLGLALVRGLAERMGVAVTGANAAGGGFEVRLTLDAA